MKIRKKNKGFITVFVTLILVPVIVFTGTMVDFSRMKLYGSQAAMAADSYGEAALSKYDNLLKELYGLFAMTQDESGLEAVKELAAYTGYSFNPDGDEKGLDGFMPYKNMEIAVTYEAVEGATLGNNNVLMTQISDFMKFRVYEEVGNKLGILDVLESVSDTSEDMKAIEQRQEVAADTTEIFNKMQQFYNKMKDINQYPAYIREREIAYENYAAALNDIFTEEDYDAYKAYVANKEAVDDAKKKVDAYNAAMETAEPVEIPNVSDEEKALADLYVNEEEYLAVVNQRISGLESRLETTSQPICFGTVDDAVTDLGRIRDGIRTELGVIEDQVTNLKAQLENCSPELRESMGEELEELEQIVEMAEDFDYVVELLGETKFNCVQLDTQNKSLWDEKVEELKDVETALKAGTQETKDWNSTISFQWESFREDSRADGLYDSLNEFFNGTNNSQPNKNAGDKKIEQADTAKDAALKAFEDDETSEARDITDTLKSQLGTPVKTGEVPGFMDLVLGNASWKGLGNTAIGKFLLSVYDFGMFSSRVSGIEPEDEEENTTEEVTQSLENVEDLSSDIMEDYFDESLTGIKMSQDVNYLYGAEIEYLLSGYNTSDKNLTYARNYICAIRMTANFVSTYTISPINTAVSTAANAAAAAVGATGVGAVAAPLVRFAVSGALRAAIAGIETASDWEALKNREAVVFYKKSIDDLTSSDGSIAALLGEEIVSDGADGGEIKLTYEDYMYILMCIFVDTDTLLQRTSNLITLNVNQAEQKTDELETLNFKMNSTVTAVKSTCTIDMDFVIVPESFVNMFLTDGDATSIIQKLEDGKYGYSVIRSY